MGMLFICLTTRTTSKDHLVLQRSHNVVSDDSHPLRLDGTRGLWLLRSCHDVGGGDKTFHPIDFASTMFLAG